MLSTLTLTFALILGAVTRNCPLFEREYKIPPVNGPVEISRDPIPTKKEKP